jgi:IS30 family transposase
MATACLNCECCQNRGSAASKLRALSVPPVRMGAGVRGPRPPSQKLPKMSDRHLTQDERYQIAILDKAGHDKSDVARVMNRNKSTIGRERARNRGYRPKQAHENTPPPYCRQNLGRSRGKLAETWIPEQIPGHLKANGQPTVSHETIYPHIYADKSAGGTLHLALRCQKVRKKRDGDVIDAVSSIIKCPSICAPSSWPTVPASATGRLTW